MIDFFSWYVWSAVQVRKLKIYNFFLMIVMRENHSYKVIDQTILGRGRVQEAFAEAYAGDQTHETVW